MNFQSGNFFLAHPVSFWIAILGTHRNQSRLTRSFLKFLFGVRLLVVAVSTVRHFVPGRFTTCTGTDFAAIFLPEKSPG